MPISPVTAPEAPARLLWAIEPFGVAYRRRTVTTDQRLAVAGDPLDTIFVPIDTIVLVARQTERDPVPLTVGMIGPEGLIGWQALLATPRWTHDAIVLAGGDVAAIAVADLATARSAHADLDRLLCQVAHNHTLQLAQSVVANLGHSVERRLARWLVMLDDRSAGDRLAVTHDQLAQLLNVRRATVTDALHVLEGERIVRSTRGRLQIRDRGALEEAAGQSYGLSENDYRASIGPFGKDSASQQS